MQELRKLQEELSKLRIKRNDLDNEIKKKVIKRDKIKSSIIDNIEKEKENWEYRAFPKKEEIWEKGLIEGLRVETRLKPAVIKKLKEVGIQLAAEYWQGMFYYRTDENIICQGDGGGELILIIQKICSDEEWDRIAKGDIPERLLR